MLSTWALLMIAVVTEIAWGCSLKALSYYSLDRIFALVPIALTCANMYLLARVMKTLPSGLTYAVWTTLGAAGVLIAGAFLFNESLNKGQIFFISVCIVGVVARVKFSLSACALSVLSAYI